MKIAQNTLGVIVSIRIFEPNSDFFSFYAKIQNNTNPIPQSEEDFSNLLSTLPHPYSFEVKVNNEVMVNIDFDIDFDADGLVDNYGSIYHKISNLR